jgi:hypothetical protein
MFAPPIGTVLLRVLAQNQSWALEAMKRCNEALNASLLTFFASVKCFFASLLYFLLKLTFYRFIASRISPQLPECFNKQKY